MGAETEKRNGVRSHIQIPKFVIKNFTDPQGKVYYYDFQKHRLDRDSQCRYNGKWIHP